MALRTLLGLTLAALLVVSVAGDFYLHGMRGSNNRNDENTTPRANGNRLFDSQNNNNGGYNRGAGNFYYYTGSVVMATWTNQHACGSNPNDHCEIIFQYMCGPDVRDGTNTNTPDTTTDDTNTGLHESRAYYADCAARERNKGLFTADQKLNGNTAIYTRQNPGGTRRGLECPEERDYYPYWHPSPWKDIAILTNNVSRCQYYTAESQNVKNKGSCSVNTANNPTSCTAAGGTWTQSGAWGLPPPECVYAPFSRDNHLGNGILPVENSFNWTLPAAVNGQKCVFRGRYNITTGDYDAWNINASRNGNLSPVRQNPTVDFGIQQGLKLAINTAQYGRTFQDRTHVFEIAPRPAAIPASASIYNINVRGKRGNIVQVYPAVEYDFVPTYLTVKQGDYVHWQWTGSNNNPQGNDGQGQAGTDRSNILQLADWNDNFPLKVENVTMFPDFTTIKRFATLGDNDVNLNNASPYFDGGLLRQDRLGKFIYMSSRNNNFSNRSQKASLEVIAA